MALTSMFIADSGARASDSPGFRRAFRPGRLTLGVLFPIESYEGDTPTMVEQERLAQRAEALGFTALWVRDVPLRVPAFGDVGQVYDPWVYLGWIAAFTRNIALGTAAIALPLRHPLHTAKAAASVDRLSAARLVLGVASGDRPLEYPAFGVEFERRSELFRDAFGAIRASLESEFPVIESAYGRVDGTADVVPKPTGRLPMLVTGHSQQSLQWIAEHADGWITYPRSLARQAEIARRWRDAVAAAAPHAWKPLAQSLYVDLEVRADAEATPIHLGFRAGRNVVLRFLESLHDAGVHHVMLNFKYAKRSAPTLLEEFGAAIIPRLNERSPEEAEASGPGDSTAV